MRPDPRPRHPVGLSKPVARRVAQAVRRVEASWGAPPDQRQSQVRPWNPGVLRAVVTTAIPTGTVSAPSTAGAVTIQSWDPYAATSAATTNPDLTAVRCCNDHTLSASVPIGTAVKVAWSDGDYWLIASDCY